MLKYESTRADVQKEKSVQSCKILVKTVLSRLNPTKRATDIFGQRERNQQAAGVLMDAAPDSSASTDKDVDAASAQRNSKRSEVPTILGLQSAGTTHSPFPLTLFFLSRPRHAPTLRRLYVQVQLHRRSVQARRIGRRTTEKLCVRTHEEHKQSLIVTPTRRCDQSPGFVA